MIAIKDYILEFKANRKPMSDRKLTEKDIHVGQKLRIKTDLSEYGTNNTGNPIVGLYEINHYMRRHLGDVMTVSKFGGQTHQHNYPTRKYMQPWVMFKEDVFYWPLEICEMVE